jgi:hypothetical protein
MKSTSNQVTSRVSNDADIISARPVPTKVPTGPFQMGKLKAHQDKLKTFQEKKRIKEEEEKAKKKPPFR